ncbi:MAG: hypothetical protein AAGA16_23835 [Cyanobacteria bacterium P01_E01_bin.35]
MFNPSFQLILSGHYDRDPGLDQYLLVLLANGKQINEWKCTSSHVNGQQRGDQHVRGGLIPPVHHIRKIDRYEVVLKPEDSRHVKGVEGNFYRILPNVVTTKSGNQRSYFGIHLDANVPGSLGCPVMNKFNFDDFEETIANIYKPGTTERIPFFPLYS